MTWVLRAARDLYVRSLYLDGGQTVVDWTEDAAEAARFVRREDAEAIADGVLGGIEGAVRAVELDAGADVVSDAREDAVAVSQLEAVKAHAARCPVGYRVGEAGDLLLWIPDDRPQRGLQLWLRELDELLGRLAYCDGDHAAPECADPQCWRGTGGAP